MEVFDFKIQLPVYGMYVHVFGGNYQKAKESFEKRYNLAIDIDDCQAFTFHMTKNFKHPYMVGIVLDELNFNPQSIGVLVHEVTHAVTYIFERLHIPISKENDESMAYLIGYLTYSILDKYLKIQNKK